jgi:site-specific DNA-methyltransferase (adenine-specific)
MIDFEINETLKSLIPPLTPEEFNQLESNCIKDGVLHKLTVGNYKSSNNFDCMVLIDGHNRYDIAKKNGLKYDCEIKKFDSLDNIKEWMIMHQFGRRNLSNYQRSILALELKGVYEAAAKERQRLSGGDKVSEWTRAVVHICEQPLEDPVKAMENKTLTKLANIAGVSHNTLNKVQKIQADARPELREQLSAGTVSINEAYKEVRASEKIQQRDEYRKESALMAKEIEIKNVFHGDSRAILSNYTGKINAVITDPPYGMGFISNRRTLSPKDEGIANDENINIAKELVINVFTKVFDIMPNNSPLFCFIGWRQEPEFIKLISDIGFTVKNSIIWVKNNHGSGDLQGSFAPKHERIIYATKGKVVLNSREPDVLNGSDIRTDHPTAKPIDLIKILINSIKSTDTIVCDPFAGHGSTAIACKELDVNFVAIEFDENNYNQIILNLSK